MVVGKRSAGGAVGTTPVGFGGTFEREANGGRLGEGFGGVGGGSGAGLALTPHGEGPRSWPAVGCEVLQNASLVGLGQIGELQPRPVAKLPPPARSGMEPVDLTPHDAGAEAQRFSIKREEQGTGLARAERRSVLDQHPRRAEVEDLDIGAKIQRAPEGTGEINASVVSPFGACHGKTSNVPSLWMIWPSLC